MCLFGRRYTVDGWSHTYRHNLPNRRVKPIEVHFNIKDPLGIVCPIKIRIIGDLNISDRLHI